MKISMQPNEPDKLLQLIGKFLKVDVSAQRERLKDITFGGPGITIREKLSDTESFVVAIDIPIDAAISK